MSKGIYWVVKNDKGELIIDELYNVYNTRADIRDNIKLYKGEKFVKVKFVEVTKD